MTRCALLAVAILVVFGVRSPDGVGCGPCEGVVLDGFLLPVGVELLGALDGVVVGAAELGEARDPNSIGTEADDEGAAAVVASDCSAAVDP